MDKATESRALRNAALDATDRYVLHDYPLTPYGRMRVEHYRQQLRDWPQSEGFPDPETMPQADTWSDYKPAVEPVPEGALR